MTQFERESFTLFRKGNVEIVMLMFFVVVFFFFWNCHSGQFVVNSEKKSCSLCCW